MLLLVLNGDCSKNEFKDYNPFSGNPFSGADLDYCHDDDHQCNVKRYRDCCFSTKCQEDFQVQATCAFNSFKSGMIKDC